MPDRQAKRKGSRPSMPIWTLLGWGVINLALLEYGLVAIPALAWPLWADVFWLAFLVVSLPAHVVLLSRWHSSTVTQKTRQLDETNDVTSRVFHLHRTALLLDCDTYSREHMLVFTKLLLEPHRSRTRIKERISVAPAGVSKSVQIDFHVPSQLAKLEDGKYLPIPIMRPLKGRLITGLEVTCQGSSLTTLTVEETLAYLARVARWLLTESFDLPGNIEDWPDDQGVRQFYNWILESLVRVPGRSALENVPEFRGEVAQAFKDKCRSLAPKNQEMFEMLGELIRLSSSNYSILAIAPAASRIQVEYEYRVPLYPLTRHSSVNMWRNIQGTVRSLLGGMPRVIEFNGAKARKCQSYHALIAVPDSVYVAEGHLLDERDRVVSRRRGARHNLGGPYFRIVGQGLSELHFYARGMRDEREGLRIRAVLAERPPGAVGRALLVSALATMAIAFFGSSKNDVVQNLDAPAAAIAVIPLTFALVSYVVNLSGRAVGVLSYLALVSSLCTAVMLLIGTSLVVAKLVSPERAQSGWTVGGMTDWRWSLLFLAALGNSLMLIGALIIRTLRTKALAALVVENIDDERVEVAD